MATKRCPFCAEEIQAEAIRCRYCRGRLVSFDIQRWHRSHPEGRLAGVCAALAHVLAVPVSVVRLGFIFFTVFFHFAPLAYAILWLVIPRRPGGQSELEGLLEWALSLAESFRGGASRRGFDSDLEVPSNGKARPNGEGEDGLGSTARSAY